MAPFQALLYYWFTAIDDPESFASDHRKLCESLDLRGRILIASEGLNGTVSGTAESCAAYQNALRSDPRFAEMEFKVDDVEGHVFKALHIRVRPEIITLGAELPQPVEQKTGVHLSPPEWLSMLDREDVVLLDGRNHYESIMGHFDGALCPEVGSFREFPEWIEAHRDQLEGKKVLTYCTGGIRCEKLSAYMLEAGFDEVYQLHGGIVEYGKHPETQGERFLGVNVVFDSRVVVSAGERAQSLTQCERCGVAAHNFVNCANVDCNRRMILCTNCESSTDRSCSDACRNTPRMREKNKKLHESVLATP